MKLLFWEILNLYGKIWIKMRKKTAQYKLN